MQIEIPTSLVQLLGWTMAAYIGLMFAVSGYAQRKVGGVEDYVVAGRRLSLPLATATLLATWFGAGTLMTAADEVRAVGLEAATLDPIGAGLCLLIVGLLFAGPLWKEKLFTLPELFGRRFHPQAEVLGAVLLVPAYLGWIAAQFMALGAILELFFGIPLVWGVALVAAVGAGYTLMGGMWAVTLTDAIQIALMIVGLLVMLVVVLGQMGDGSAAAGLEALWAATPPEKRTLVPSHEIGPLLTWVGVLCAGALGNVPSQELMQRVFSARSAATARRACLLAGMLYLTLGAAPVLLGLAGGVLFPAEAEGGTVPLLASLFLHPALAVIFVVTLLSAVLSTIDSALLAPATVLAHDLLERLPRFADRPLSTVRLGVLIVAGASLGLAYLGESAYGLLESSYELGMVSLLAPLTYAVYGRVGGRVAALASMASGTTLWLVHAVAGWESFAGLDAPLPVGLICTAVAFVAFPLGARLAGEGARA